MATAFDGLGMGMLGSERQYIKGGGPISEAAKGLKDFAIVSAIQKSGLQEYLNKMGAKSDQAVPPPADASAAINPAAPPAPVPFTPEAPVVAPMQADPLQNQADKAFGIQSSITPNLFQPRDTAQDQTAMQMQVSAPPTNVGQQQMGKDIPKGGGIDMRTILSLAKFFI